MEEGFGSFGPGQDEDAIDVGKDVGGDRNEVSFEQ